jgi:hypothetical protein
MLLEDFCKGLGLLSADVVEEDIVRRYCPHTKDQLPRMVLAMAIMPAGLPGLFFCSLPSVCLYTPFNLSSSSS